MKKLNKKGFTLAELLIVVAIIAVLVAIAIPVFSGQLEKAREATDEANIRALYAECVSSALTGEASSSNVTYDSTKKEAKGTYKLTQTKDGLTSGDKIIIGSVEINSDKFTTGTATVTADADGKVTIAISK